MIVSADNRLVLRDVYVGDVWVCSGQSNMELMLNRVQGRYSAEIAAGENPKIRQFTVPDRYDFKEPQRDYSGGEWEAATPQSLLRFSAVAWFFAKQLYEKYQVPIGLINASLGGSPVEAWMSEAALENFPHHLETAKKFRDDNMIAEIERADRYRRADWHHLLRQRDPGFPDGETAWFADEFDASAWPQMLLPSFWKEYGLDMHGTVWFRRAFTVPADMAGKEAYLEMGRIVDADSTFINGRFVGSVSYQYPPRRYNIPAGVLRTGENNITVRVINYGGSGGFVQRQTLSHFCRTGYCCLIRVLALSGGCKNGSLARTDFCPLETDGTLQRQDCSVGRLFY